MRQFSAFLLALLLALPLAACGGDSQAEDIPPAQEPASVDQVQEDPLANYFDLSSLSDEALAQVRQDIGQTQTADGITVHLKQAVGDSRSLCVAFDVTYPEGTDTPPAFTAQLALGSSGDGSEPGVRLDGGSSSVQTQGTTYACLADFYYAAPCLTGQEITLRLEDLGISAPLDFTWTVETTGFFAQADLMDESGSVVGTAALSPFFLSLDLPPELYQDYEGYETWEAFSWTIQLLDEAGNAQQNFMGWQGGESHFCAMLFCPLAEGTVTTIQADGLTGTFS